MTSTSQKNNLMFLFKLWFNGVYYNQDNEQKLTSSEEVASILSSQMSKMAPLAADWKDTLQQVYTQAPYDSVRANLHEVIRAY